MTGDVLGLYQQVILDHYRNPRNLRPLIDGARHAEGHNPLCGDRITVYVRLSDDGHLLIDATFEGDGCAICIASASLMTEIVRGKTVAEIGRLAQRVHDLVTAAADAPSTIVMVWWRWRACAGFRFGRSAPSCRGTRCMPLCTTGTLSFRPNSASLSRFGCFNDAFVASWAYGPARGRAVPQRDPPGARVR